MLAGVGGVDACLFVVAATEGWKPQSEEHLRILELLGIGHGVVALTKVDLVDDEVVELAALDVAERVAGDVPRRRADRARVGDDRRRARRPARRARRLVADHAAGADRARPRLWVDRVFAAKGSGTVVTGTLDRRVARARSSRSSSSRAGDRPASAAIQTHGAAVDGDRARQPGRPQPRRHRPRRPRAVATQS